MNFPNRLLFRFRLVVAFPNPSSSGELRISSSDSTSVRRTLTFERGVEGRVELAEADDDDVSVLERRQTNCMTCLQASVFPAPLSPATIITCGSPVPADDSALIADAATANTCGGRNVAPPSAEAAVAYSAAMAGV